MILLLALKLTHISGDHWSYVLDNSGLFTRAETSKPIGGEGHLKCFKLKLNVIHVHVWWSLRSSKFAPIPRPDWNVYVSNPLGEYWRSLNMTKDLKDGKQCLYLTRRTKLNCKIYAFLGNSRVNLVKIHHRTKYITTFKCFTNFLVINESKEFRFIYLATAFISKE